MCLSHNRLRGYYRYTHILIELYHLFPLRVCVVWILKRLVGWKSMRFMVWLKVYIIDSLECWRAQKSLRAPAMNERSRIQSILRQIVCHDMKIVHTFEELPPAHNTPIKGNECPLDTNARFNGDAGRTFR